MHRFSPGLVSGNPALRVIVLFGLAALLGDVIYEGAWSVSGPYILLLGGSAAVVGFVAGAGEFLGYGLRLASGYAADRTRQYWGITIAGYTMLVAVPLLALAGRWETAAVLFALERVGKAVRSPAKDALLSHAAKGVGRGWGFAIHEALDQIGAILGPLLFTAIIVLGAGGLADYRLGFTLLLVPFLLLMAFLLFARSLVPDPVGFEEAISRGAPAAPAQVPPIFPLYALFTALSMLGFAAFPIIAFHWKLHAVVPDAQIPLLFALAMGVDAISALIAGAIYDRRGLSVLAVIPLLSLLVPLFAFTTSPGYAVFSAILWGAAVGLQETVLRAAIADYTHIQKRGTVYGIFNAIFGGAWFAGSVIIGLLYDTGIGYILAFVAVTEIGAFIAFRSIQMRT